MEKNVLVKKKKKTVYESTPHAFASTSLFWKTVHGVETYSFSSEEKVLDAVVIKEGDADSLLEYERTHHYWFLEKCAPINNDSYCQLFQQNSLYLMNNFCIMVEKREQERNWENSLPYLLRKYQKKKLLPLLTSSCNYESVTQTGTNKINGLFFYLIIDIFDVE